MDNISYKIVESIFEPLGNISHNVLLKYAMEMKDNAQDNIEWSIAESVIRFARLEQMSEALITEGYFEKDEECANNIT